ncbi:MAG: DUF92 domain-containing protein [Gemmatimonadales bacterium]
MKWLTPDGLVAALAVGAAVAVGLGWRGVVVLLAFFVSGSLLTQLAGTEGGRRTARQVVANGGVAALAALVGAWGAAAGALAAATADTWATEIGSFSPRPPRLITRWIPVPRGTSGGITFLGTAGGVAGAVLLGWAAVALAPRPGGGGGDAAAGSGYPEWGLAWVVTGAGIAGMLLDSVLGATAQGQFECASCGARFERAGTLCHEPVRRIRGFRWLDNDGVNLAATVAGAALAELGWRCCS